MYETAVDACSVPLGHLPYPVVVVSGVNDNIMEMIHLAAGDFINFVGCEEASFYSSLFHNRPKSPWRGFLNNNKTVSTTILHPNLWQDDSTTMQKVSQLP